MTDTAIYYCPFPPTVVSSVNFIMPMSPRNTRVFECCKKAFIHYVCMTCSKVYHKACIAKMKENIEVISDNRIICCQSREPENIVDTSVMEKTIQDLAEDSLMKGKYIEKLKKVKEDLVEEALRNESELIVRIEKQEKLIQELKRQLVDLKLQMDESVKEVKNVSTQTITKNTHHKQTMTKHLTRCQTASIGIQTISTTTLKNSITKRTNVKTTNGRILSDNQSYRKQVLFVSGNHGKGMIKFLISRESDKYSVQSIIKPNATNDELLKTAISNSLYFTPYDIVILWCDKINNHLHNKVLSHFENTRLLILTEPYRYDIPGINDIIYQNNLKLLEVITKLKPPNKIVLDCNNSLRVSNYHRDKFSLTMTGKRFLCRKIFDTIEISENGNLQVPVKRTNADIPPARTSYDAPNIENNSHHDAMEEIIETPGQRNHFLYPRLSQVAPFLI